MQNVQQPRRSYCPGRGRERAADVLLRIWAYLCKIIRPQLTSKSARGIGCRLPEQSFSSSVSSSTHTFIDPPCRSHSSRPVSFHTRKSFDSALRSARGWQCIARRRPECSAQAKCRLFVCFLEERRRWFKSNYLNVYSTDWNSFKSSVGAYSFAIVDTIIHFMITWLL